MDLECLEQYSDILGKWLIIVLCVCFGGLYLHMSYAYMSMLDNFGYNPLLDGPVEIRNNWTANIDAGANIFSIAPIILGAAGIIAIVLCCEQGLTFLWNKRKKYV